ncbi:hypothetical protein HanPSC8_Chr14g0607841 [Helianthus annuus]|nr:hypothetical protein HanPSC8_Chr14g0607841 [Helianthus annuus]
MLRVAVGANDETMVNRLVYSLQYKRGCMLRSAWLPAARTRHEWSCLVGSQMGTVISHVQT